MYSRKNLPRVFIEKMRLIFDIIIQGELKLFRYIFLESMMDAQEVHQPEGENEPVAGFARSVSGEQVEFGPGFSVSISAGQDMTMAQAGAATISVGRDLDLSYGGALGIAVGNRLDAVNSGATIMPVGGDLDMTNGGAMILPVGGNATIVNGGALVMPVGGTVTAEKSKFGVVLAPEVVLGEGSQVLLNTQQALAFGAAFGFVFGLVSWLLRKR